MTNVDMQHFAFAIVKLSVLGGVFGAICSSMISSVIVRVADSIQAWEDKRTRIGAARARAHVRHINGVRID